MRIDNSSPKISVLLPVFNAEKFLKESIESILNQTFKDFELIVINDGSIDNSENIIQSYTDSRIRYIRNETNLGLIKTLNIGIELSEGKYIARMDADDICSLNRFEKQYNFLEQNTDVVLCGSWVKRIDEFGNVKGKIRRIDTNELIRANMLFTTPFIHPTVMIRKEVLAGNLYNTEAKHCEDLELWVRLSQISEYQFYNLPNYLLFYRIHSSNVSVLNVNFQTEKRKQLLLPYIEKLVGNVTEEELNVHFSSFSINPLSKIEIEKLKKWISVLSEKNKTYKLYDQKSLEALLFSRWIIVCVRSKNYLKLLNVHLAWYRPNILVKTLKLLIFK
jgi:glycosyltransferase involved in cell wall biosynthesis